MSELALRPIHAAREILSGHVAHNMPMHPRVCQTVLGLLTTGAVALHDPGTLIRAGRTQLVGRPQSTCCSAAQIARGFLSGDAITIGEVIDLAAMVVALHSAEARHDA